MAEETWEQDGDGGKEFVDEVSESAEYSPKSDFSKAQIVYAQVERCCSLRSEEMRSGYTTHVIDKMGNTKLVHVTDTRKKFIGSVDALKNLLMPEIKRLREKKRKEKKEEGYIEEFDNAKEEIKKLYVYKETKVSYEGGENKLVFTGRDYIPETGEILISGFKPIKKGIMGIDKVEGLWDSKVNAYYNDLLELYDILFADLNCLINDLNYFKQSMNF